MTDREAMLRCLELAARARGRTSPNPMVGAVVVRDGRVVGEGYHERAGSPHAEVVALRQAGELARGATLYVNLEPCDHHGRTPPCTEAILAAGVRRVVVGMVDPNPLVDGRGIARLRAAGVEVEVGVEEPACRELNRAFVKAVRERRPWVVLKAAASLDGRIATVSGESRWISGPESREHGHRLRDQLDAILVGRGTLLADDPRLDCRLPGGRDPLPVVLDSELRTPPTARIFGGSRRPVIFSAREAPPGYPGEVVRVPRAAGGGLELGTVLRALLERGVQSVLVEGGGRVHRSFLEAGLVDELHLYLAPLVLAGGPSWVAGPGVEELERAWRFELREVERLGADLHLVYRPRED